MKVKMAYYISRLLFSAVFSSLFFLAGGRWWLAIIVGVIAFGWFLWAPYSGWYVVHAEKGATHMRRDERGQLTADRAARYAFMVTIIAVGGLVIYFGLIASASVPVPALSLVCALGMLTYFGAIIFLRRA
jgi:hypothetical protein